MILKILGLVLFFELYNYWFVRLNVRRAVWSVTGKKRRDFGDVDRIFHFYSAIQLVAIVNKRVLKFRTKQHNKRGIGPYKRRKIYKGI